MKLSCWKMSRIKVVTLLGIKEGSCTSTRGKQRCSCNTSPMMALMLKPEVVKCPQTVNGPIWTQDRKERHRVRGLLPPQLVQAPPPPPATTVPAARHRCRRSCLGEVGGHTRRGWGQSGWCRGMESHNEALQQLSTAIFRQPEISIPSQALFRDMSLSLREITPAAFQLNHRQAESFPQNSQDADLFSLY